MNAYSVLESGVQAKLTAQRALIDGLLTKIASLEAAQTLDAAKHTAKTTLGMAYAKYASSEYTTNYAQLTAAKNTGIVRVDAATTVSGVITAQDNALAAMAAVKSDAVLLTEAKTSAAAVLNAYYPRGLSEAAYSSTYNATGKAQVAELRKAGTLAIKTAAATADINTQLAAYKGFIDAVKTSAELKAEALAAAKTSAKAELTAYGNNDAYRTAEKTAFANAKAIGSSSIDAVTTIADVASALENAKAAIDSLQTDAQLTVIELVNAKKAAKASISAYKANEDYSESGWKLITSKISEWCSYVDNCKYIDDIINATSVRSPKQKRILIRLTR